MGVGSLSGGYASQGLIQEARGFLIFGALWLFARWRKWKWFHSPGLLIVVFAAAYGLWIGLAFGWMILGSVGGLLAWDLANFSRRLTYASPTDDIAGMERVHILRAGMVAAFGALLAFLAFFVHLQMKFEIIVGLVVLVVIGLARLVVTLRRE